MKIVENERFGVDSSNKIKFFAMSQLSGFTLGGYHDGAYGKDVHVIAYGQNPKYYKGFQDNCGRYCPDLHGVT